MTRAKSKVAPHVFVPDPDVPPDQNGRRTCVCHLVGQPGDSHHTMPDVPAQAAVLARYEPRDDE